MTVNRKWIQRNIGFDPIERPAPISTFAFPRAATSSENVDLQREIIDFDSEAPAGRRVSGVYDSYRAFAIYGHPMAERTKAKNG